MQKRKRAIIYSKRMKLISYCDSKTHPPVRQHQRQPLIALSCGIDVIDDYPLVRIKGAEVLHEGRASASDLDICIMMNTYARVA